MSRFNSCFSGHVIDDDGGSAQVSDATNHDAPGSV